MSFDLFEQLRETEVPDAPSTIEEGIHRRVNNSLTVNHLVDFLCGALPSAIMEFGNPFGELLKTSFSNRKPPERRGQ